MGGQLRRHVRLLFEQRELAGVDLLLHLGGDALHIALGRPGEALQAIELIIEALQRVDRPNALAVQQFEVGVVLSLSDEEDRSRDLSIEILGGSGQLQLLPKLIVADRAVLVQIEQHRSQLDLVLDPDHLASADRQRILTRLGVERKVHTV